MMRKQILEVKIFQNLKVKYGQIVLLFYHHKNRLHPKISRKSDLFLLHWKQKVFVFALEPGQRGLMVRIRTRLKIFLRNDTISCEYDPLSWCWDFQSRTGKIFSFNIFEWWYFERRSIQAGFQRGPNPEKICVVISTPFDKKSQNWKPWLVTYHRRIDWIG